MKLESSAFDGGGMIPAKFATTRVAGGRNLSPPLAWSDPPNGTKSFALSVVDPHPVARNWVHWLAVGIPPDARSLVENASEGGMPQVALELRNSFGNIGYGGPQPPPGSGLHPYVFTLYALDVEKISLPTDVGLAGFTRAISPHVLGQAELTGYFER
jgi:Raf kinase inhibitor-like YbhB/YbcL family protein